MKYLRSKAKVTSGRVRPSLVSLWGKMSPQPVRRVVPTCLYLAGRLQPQACNRPSSFRTCSRTWRYCSRFCSRRAEDVQSLRRETTASLLNLWLKIEAEG